MSRKRDFNAGNESSQAQGVQQRVRQMLVIERLCRRLPLIAQQLQSRHDGRETLQVKDAFDLRDLLNAVLRLAHDDVRAETWTPTAADSARTDFLLKIERTVLVAQFADARFDARALAAQLPADVAHYRQHPDCDTLVCFVYDPERRIAGARAIEHDLSDDQQQPTVRVIIAPQAS
jgi:hypothetical protein